LSNINQWLNIKSKDISDGPQGIFAVRWLPAIHVENRGGKDRKKLALRFVVVVRSSSRMFIEPYLQKYYLHTSFAKFPCCAPPKENHSKALSAQNLLKERPCHTNFQQSDSKFPLLIELRRCAGMEISSIATTRYTNNKKGVRLNSSARNFGLKGCEF